MWRGGGEERQAPGMHGQAVGIHGGSGHRIGSIPRVFDVLRSAQGQFTRMSVLCVSVAREKQRTLIG
jgi:hypothetical protein